MGAFLDKPKTDKHYESGSGNGVRFALCSMQGWRIDMEDAHTALTALGPPFDSWSFFGVFDGHAGGKVSKYCSEHLVRYVTDTEEFNQLKDENLSPEKKRDFIKRGLVRGFLNLDEVMRKLPEVLAGEDRSGSTAICCLVTPDVIYLANCGDSRGIIVSKETVTLATYDHKPVNPVEKERIHNAGGSVMIQRVNGSLAVSRALGDFEYKRVPGLGPFEQLISPEPEISDWGRGPQDEFVLLACDGVWDVMNNEEVSQFVRYQLTVTDDLEKICEGLVDNCLNKGSRDNISVILIVLPGAPRLSEEARQNEESIERSIESAVKDILQKDQQTPGQHPELDVTTLTHMVHQVLEKNGVTFPPGTCISAKRNVIERTWKELRPSEELRQEPGRAATSTIMSLFRAKQQTAVSEGSPTSPHPPENTLQGTAAEQTASTEDDPPLDLNPPIAQAPSDHRPDNSTNSHTPFSDNMAGDGVTPAAALQMPPHPPLIDAEKI
ncbi:protein phosphatase 1A-like [Paramacrobiotus metropolitanus]|uniref:protein phosphatase 1A-like n=1 Tax=Paramacrobiotus metropolitanus TaxID=2943436 RepID=UPI0024464850|nr:protein phosphatase 1A-like [Paramacrobiotus metropolitanus]XP_055341341.1 protein phosphatase 1A-like [Paramacrobiotus metropolitanus]XP_055341349.1 protein phosphatase 1A-like [Paramacrobiotus metropolitanus]XP_055341356.1 protein phosphatase 1A-like [Paramacrobiotus metropolitanus]XP_055341365.1 protein phosphatase 1A-like [Paramacrobiotus metropolitanus]XP_055341374.1 protein phosphatase 1A-like [Paramacrobiotus metropolitanus]XP_055341382.1 protein phosphatase 1A-like [Paramacrobiotus